MTYQPKDKTGALFINGEKEPGSQQPDFRGYVLIDNVRIQLAAWKRWSKTGSEYLSLQLDDKQDGEAPSGERCGDE